jgi:hypothetical protein
VGLGYGQFTHAPAGIDGDDLPAFLGQPVGVAARACAYVAGEPGGYSLGHYTFLMAAFVRVFAQKVTAEICPVQPFVIFLFSDNARRP